MIEKIKFFLKTGISTKTLNEGKPVEEIVIRFKDYYLSIMIDAETGEPTGDFSWTDNESVFDVLLREMYEAKRIGLVSGSPLLKDEEYKLPKGEPNE